MADRDLIFRNATRAAFANLMHAAYNRPPANLLDGPERMAKALEEVLDARPDLPVEALHRDYRVEF